MAAGLVSLGLGGLGRRRLVRWIVRVLRPCYVYGHPGRSIVWLERLRTVGMLGAAAVYLVYLGAATDVALLAAALRIQDGMRSLPTILLAMLLLVAVTRRKLRATVVVALGRPLAALLLVVAFAASIIVAVNTADAHPMLPATTTIFYAAMSAGWYLYDGVPPRVPATVDRLIALGGPAVLVLLASVELSILRRPGMTLTQPPPRISSAASRPRARPS